ncbi:IS66 family insertion sequence element accessory protein TnpA [Belliella kenyensis]|uniref:IS66 family insertion sequence element accessory protein TnpA n=1 Tax=Belliella kenyensis TaxID=1472724 RepID=UPI001F4A2506|nr:IS66 family insertion sequence element accessory protein TnpB [Belliella kenyensis]MCH7401205.1 IS66 family insertion sequence element accessory protein TnpB [Belliella kenyensis]MDN3601812.1 IS66 family insertion sequence element accessory protein TnpB [Belliella kenyensis]MDN3602651.1 IS66 family insertion sequence element accessory protein TnpB [Belliella kenyensis]
MNKREEMLELIAEFKTSGLSQRAFCDSKGFTLHNFNYWYRKLKREELSESGDVSRFLKVDISNLDNPSLSIIELEYPNGVKLKISTLDIPIVSRLIKLF